MARQFTVLVVEDDRPVRDVLLTVLAKHGLTVLAAEDGYEAIRILVERHVDLMFTDIVMPGISGFQLALQAKLIRPSLKILYCTGFAEQAEARDGLRHGKLLRKPIRVAELTEEIDKALAG